MQRLRAFFRLVWSWVSNASRFDWIAFSMVVLVVLGLIQFVQIFLWFL